MAVEFQYVRLIDMPYSGLVRFYVCDINDPTAEDKSPAKEYRKDALRALCWRTFVAEIAPTGQVRRIEDFSRFYDELHRALAFDGELPRNIRIGDENLYRKEMEESHDRWFKEFFGGYWPLSEGRLKETVQQFFLIRPDEAISPGESWHTEEVLPAPALRCRNLWTFRKPRAAIALVDFFSQVRMDLDLCEPNVPEIPWAGGFDYLSGACRWYQTFKEKYSCTGQRTGFFHVDMKTGLIQDATWTEELTGAVILRDATGDKPESQACLSKRTMFVYIGTFTGE